MSEKIDAGVQKCIAALKSAKNDTEKMAALFLVTKVTKAAKLNRDSRLALFDAIGFKFLIRLLNTPSTPDCPSLLYKSVALSILTSFCSDPTIAESPEMLDAVPIFLKIVEDSYEGDDDDDQLLVVVNEAYHCLQSVATTEKGGMALVKTGAIPRLVNIYCKQDAEEVLEVMRNAARVLGIKTWDKCPDQFNVLMDRVSLQFEADQSEQKFELCGIMASIMMSYNMNRESVQTAFWPSSILKGLVDILSSKITEKQRDPAIKLASIMLTTLGIEWLLKNSAEGPKAYQFLTLLVNLSCIEVRMTLEDRTLDKILPKEDLIGSCYAIIETTITFISGTGTQFEHLEDKQKEQLYQALKGASTAILGFLNLLQRESGKNPKFWDARKKMLACASVRCLSAWMAEESAGLKDEMYKLLPFVLGLAFESFADAELNQSVEAMTMAELGKSTEPLMPDLLCTLLPALCHLTAAETGVQLLLQAKGDELLYKFLTHNWSVYKNLQELVEKQSRPKKQRKGKEDKVEDEINLEELKSTILKMRASLMHTCNLFINITVLDPELVSSNSVFQQIMRWCFGALTVINNPEEELVLLSNVAGLGLLLLLHFTKSVADAKAEGKVLSPEEDFQSSRLISGTDNAVFRFAQSVIRFVWDAHLPDESQSPVTLVITSNYRAVWSDIKEMWFLSLQTVGSLFETLPWMSDFAAESGFLEAVISNISKAYKPSIDASTLAAYEDFLSATIKGSEKASNIIKTKGAALAASHHLRGLKKALG